MKKSYNNHAFLTNREAPIMKKVGLLIVCLLFISVLFSACKSTPNSPIKYERKLGKYFESENKSSGGMIDLSEGPKLRYNANFGPKDLNFDIKIINPY